MSIRFSLNLEGPEYEALCAVLPEGATVKPYHIFTGVDGQTTTLWPENVCGSSMLGYRDRLLGFVELTLPTGVVAIAGFAVSFNTLMQMGQGQTEYHGRESA